MALSVANGDGLTSLQFRPAAGAETQEIRSTVNAPIRIRIVRRGSSFTAFAGKPGEELTATAPQEVNLPASVYIGLGVCSHDARRPASGSELSLHIPS